MDFYTNQLAANAALNLSWWATSIKRTWKLDASGVRVYGWELI